MKLLKVSDFDGMVSQNYRTDSEGDKQSIINQLNDVLEERLEVGYTSDDRELITLQANADCPSYVLATITTDQADKDTHKIYYFTEPLEEEVEGICNLDHSKIGMFIFCPMCAERLGQ